MLSFGIWLRCAGRNKPVLMNYANNKRKPPIDGSICSVYLQNNCSRFYSPFAISCMKSKEALD